MSSGKQTLPQSPWMTTGTPQLEHQVGSSFHTAYDIWSGTIIYYLTRTSCQLNAVGQKIPSSIFVNVLDCDFTGKMATSISTVTPLPGQSPSVGVALYIQAHSQTKSGGCHIWALNPLVDKVGVFPAHCAEFDFNNNCGQDDPPYGDANSGVCLDVEAGASKNSTLFGLVVGQSQLAAGYKPFRQAIWIYQSFDTIGLLLKSAVSNPDAYLRMIPWDDLNTSARMIQLFNAAQTKEVFVLFKNGQIKVANPTINAADCLITNETVSGGTGVLLSIKNAMTTKYVAAFNADQSMQFYSTLNLMLTAGVTGLVIYYTGDTYSRIMALGDGSGFGFGPGNAATDTTLFRGGVGQLSTNGSFRATSTIQAGGYKSADGTSGITDDVAVSAGTATITLHFKNGLYIGST